jgi:hypothetical protein
MHAGLGLKYMLDNTYQYIKKGDIIVIAPEYPHFYGNFYFGSEELLRTVWDVNKSKIKFLNLRQAINCAPFFFKFVISKLNIIEYIDVRESDVYGINSFNQYGDVYTHWDLENRKFLVTNMIDIKSYNPKAMEGIKNFEEMTNQKGAVLYLSYPSYQDSSFDKSIEAINNVKEEYIKYGFTILGDPYRYRMADSLMFNTAYHLNKAGTDYRTLLLIEDLKKELRQSHPLE